MRKLTTRFCVWWLRRRYCEPGKSLLIEGHPNTPEWEHELVAGIHLHPEEPNQ